VSNIVYVYMHILSCILCISYARYHNNLLTSCALYYCNLSYPSISYAQNLLTSYAFLQYTAAVYTMKRWMRT